MFILRCVVISVDFVAVVYLFGRIKSKNGTKVVIICENEQIVKAITIIAAQRFKDIWIAVFKKYCNKKGNIRSETIHYI